MEHLSEDQLYELAQTYIDQRVDKEIDEALLAHLKECSQCFDEFMAFSFIEEVMDDPMVLSFVKNENENQAKVSQVILDVVVQRVRQTAKAIISQCYMTNARYQFSPSLAFGARGIQQEETSICKVEDVNDEKTFLAFDAESGELYIQIFEPDESIEQLKVTISSEEGKSIELDLKRQGKFIKGHLEDISFSNFKITIN